MSGSAALAICLVVGLAARAQSPLASGCFRGRTWNCRLGTHPLRVDAPHPADLSPRDNRITIAELSAYHNAWRTTNPWTLSPTNIPIEDVPRATHLWEGGEYCRQETNAASGGGGTAPWWWVKAGEETR